MACIEPSTPAGLRSNLLLLCESATEDLLESVQALSDRARVAVAARSSDDRWFGAAFASGAVACAAGVADHDDLSAFASMILGFF